MQKIGRHGGGDLNKYGEQGREFGELHLQTGEQEQFQSPYRQ